MDLEAETTPPTPENPGFNLDNRKELLNSLVILGGILAFSAGGGYLASRYLRRWFDEKVERDLRGYFLHDHPLLETYIDFVTSQRQPVDYLQITQNTRAVNFGESHDHLAPKDELAEHMPEFADLGFTHLGMEFFNSDFQPTLDKYFDTGQEREKILTYLVRKNSLGGIVTEYSLEYGKRYMQIVEAARKNNLRILGLDLPQDQFDKRREEITQAGKADVQRRNELEQILTDEREENMSSVTASILEAPGARMMNFTGGNHNDRVATMLEETTGIKGTSVNFTSKTDLIETWLFEYATYEVGSEDERFMVKITPEWKRRLDSQDKLLRDDYLIHLPSLTRIPLWP